MTGLDWTTDDSTIGHDREVQNRTGPGSAEQD
jgi:hypothetical protein